MADNVLKIIGEFVDNISPGLNNVAQNAGTLQAVMAGLAGGFALGAAEAVFEKLFEVIGDVVTELPKLTLEAIEAADELGKMAQRTGLAAEELQGLTLAADLADVSMQQLAGGLGKINRSIRDAAGDETTKAGLLFKSLGIEAKDANGKLITSEQVLYKLADAFAENADSAEKTALAMDLGGKSLVQMIPMLNKGSEELRKMKSIQEGMGFGFTKEQMDMAETFNDSWRTIGITLKGIGAVIAQDLLPGLSTMAEYFAEGAKEGGTLNAIVRATGEALSFMAKFISPIIYGFATITAVIKATAQSLAGLAAAASFALKWDFTAAKAALKEMDDDVRKTYEDLAVFVDKSQNPENYAKPAEGKKPDNLPNSTDLQAQQREKERLAREAEQLQKEYEKALSKMRKDLAMADESGRTAQVKADIEDGAYKKFSKNQQETLLGLAREIDLKKQLVELAKQDAAAKDALDKKLNMASETAFATKNVDDPVKRAGLLAAKQQELDMNEKLNAQAEVAGRNADKNVREQMLAEIEARRAKYRVGGELYNQAKDTAEQEYKLLEASKAYTDAIGGQTDALAKLVIAQSTYDDMLASGKISQEKYNQLILEATRKQEDLTNAIAGTNKAYNDIVTTRRGMEDVVKSMAAVRDSYESGKISSAEYKKSMYDLQASYDNLNPTYAINQVQKMNDEITRTTGAFEGMFSDFLFNGMQGKWENLGNMVKRIIDKMVANMLAAQIQMALFGDMGSTPAGKTPASTGLIGGLFSAAFGGFREAGGPVTAGMSYIVGEKRPEVFTPSVSGNISPSVGGTVINISAVDTQSFKQALAKDPRFLASLTTGAQKAYGIR